MTAIPKLVIWGAGGHALVVEDIMRLRQEYEIVGFLDDVNLQRKGARFGGGLILGGQEQLAPLRQRGVRHMIIAFGACHARLELARVIRSLEYSLLTAVHPGATVASSASIEPGTVIAAGSVIGPGACVGQNAIVNTCASVDHECVVEEGVHIGPGVHLAGRVQVGRATWIGIGAVVADGVCIGPESVIGAGSVVLSDIPTGVVAYGVPAKVAKEIPETGRNW
jgi:acetyltransferase EpsM